MDVIEALHTALRRYCKDRIRAAWREYDALGRRGLATRKEDRGSWDYTDEARRLFPRYQALSKVLEQIEQFVPADFASFEEARETLAHVGGLDPAPLLQMKNATEVEAARDECSSYSAFARGLTPEAVEGTEPLPFRRRLIAAEYERLEAKLFTRWGRWYGGCCDLPSVPPYLTLHSAFMDPPGRLPAIRTWLGRRGVSRLWELREARFGYEIDIEDAEFRYTGDEGFWTSADMEWMIYASHESSITFGGLSLANEVTARWPECERYRYKGYDLSKYDLT